MFKLDQTTATRPHFHQNWRQNGPICQNLSYKIRYAVVINDTCDSMIGTQSELGVLSLVPFKVAITKDIND
jgi:hypothetical protein